MPDLPREQQTDAAIDACGRLREHPISVEMLRALIRLDGATGRLYWLPRSRAQWNGKYAGKEALTTVAARGFRFGMIFGRNYKAHRVSFALHYGRWPVGIVDHKDTDPGNNRPENLREATKRQNGQNMKPRGGASQYKGVRWHSESRKWVASCSDAAGRTRHLGMFTSEIDASRARDAAAREWHGEFALLNGV
jgi:hypothetical protein